MTEPVKLVRSRKAAPAADVVPAQYSEDRLADRFAQQYLSRLRYVHVWGRWLLWTGTHWATEDTRYAYDLARSICREAVAELSESEKKLASSIGSAKTVAAIQSLANADRRIAATVDQWDTDPMLLNTPGGTIDLHTGTMRPHAQEDYITKVTAAAPGGDCPTWLDFLRRITGGDAELQAFLQRMVGYCLTGDTSAQALFFPYGTGANGKSVFVDTIAGLLGDYHRTAPIETFTATIGDQHPTNLAGLRGARLVTAQETEEGRRWAESRIKQLTGGDKVAARFMRQDFFEFTPQFKLIIAGNHKPGLRSVDEAIRRRFHLLPFAVTIPPEERDPDLKDKLKAEWPGILAWAVQGCLEWQRTGLRPPPAVTQATALYLEAEDSLGAWIEERCERDPQAQSLSSHLYADWKDYATKAGEFVGTNKRFAQALETRGYRSKHTNKGAAFLGLKLRDPVPAQSHWSDQ